MVVEVIGLRGGLRNFGTSEFGGVAAYNDFINQHLLRH